MTGYVDGFVLAVPMANRERFRAMAQRVARVFVEHGALRVVENWGDDVPLGRATWFARAVDLAEGEVVCFSWVEWPSREARERGNAAIAADPRVAAQPGEEDIMDSARMIYGGFLTLVDERRDGGAA